MPLPEADESYLNSKGYRWELVPDPSGSYIGFLVIHDYKLSHEKYNLAVCDLMIRIPRQYNETALDMFYVHPDLTVKSTNQAPAQAEVHETYAEINWQRFSRHLPEPWRAGVDTIRTILVHADRELKGGV